MAEQYVKEADELHEQKKIQEVFDTLQKVLGVWISYLILKAYKEFPDDVEIAWRLARAYFDISESKSDPEWKKTNLNAGNFSTLPLSHII